MNNTYRLACDNICTFVTDLARTRVYKAALQKTLQGIGAASSKSCKAACTVECAISGALTLSWVATVLDDMLQDHVAGACSVFSLDL